MKLMLEAKQTHLSFSARFCLMMLALLLLQLNVPVSSGNGLSLSRNFKLPTPPLNFWQPARLLMASARLHIEKLQNTLLAELSAKTFKIVKIESKRITTAMAWPVRGAISSGFGMRRHPVTGRNSFHAGVDIKARYGTAVVSPIEGTVVSAGRAGLLGRLVKIRTKSGKILYFAHLQKIKCKKGQQISRGQLIGTVGASGRATGPHLHFAVVEAGKYINPMKFLSVK